MTDLLLFAEIRKTFKISYHQMYDSEYIGNAFLALACNYIIQSDYRKAYDFMRYGMTLATCDCKLVTLFDKKFGQSVSQLSVESGKINDEEEYKNYFLQAAVGIYKKSDENIDQLMFCIDQYLECCKDDAVGLAVKGRLYSVLGNYENAALYLEKSLANRKLSSTLYRLGRSKQLDKQSHKPLDIKYLLEAYLMNPFCGCALSHLIESLKRYDIEPYKNSELDLTFVSKGEHDSLYWQFHCTLFDEPIMFGENEINKFDFIHGYARMIGENYDRIIKEASQKSDSVVKKRLSMTEEVENEGDSNNSYEKYNGAYGYNDDTINSAFEGDPENYWNVD